jgi:hypothetical protein
VAGAGNGGPVERSPRLAPSPPLPPLARKEFEFGELDRWLDLADQAILRTQRALREYAAGEPAAAGTGGMPGRDPG